MINRTPDITYEQLHDKALEACKIIESMVRKQRFYKHFFEDNFYAFREKNPHKIAQVICDIAYRIAWTGNPSQNQFAKELTDMALRSPLVNELKNEKHRVLLFFPSKCLTDLRDCHAHLTKVVEKDEKKRDWDKQVYGR